MAWFEKSQGSDGAFAGRVPKSRVKPLKTNGIPQNFTATSMCDTCGTSGKIAGRPGQIVTSFTCRRCKTTCDNLNNGLGFTFFGLN